MRNRGQLILGAILVALGLISLASIVFNIDFGAICWPVLLIALGVFLVLRPRFAGPDSGREVNLLGELRRRGIWTVRSEEFWQGVGDIELDLTQASIPPGESVIQIYTFVSDVDVLVPRSVGVNVHVSSFVIDADLLGRSYDGFLSPAEVSSENYASAGCRVRIEMTGFVANLKVKQV